MKDEFLIDVKDWLGSANSSDIEKVTYADLMMSAHNKRHIMTSALHGGEKKPRDTLHVPAHLLACWFASNWWRLRWEPEFSQDDGVSNRSRIDWQMSHNVNGTSGGYQWPDVTITSEGDVLRIHSQASKGRPSKYSVHFINNFDIHVSADSFEKAVDTFLSAVIKRSKTALQRKGGEADEDASDLKGLWAEICEERNDPELARWRKAEAILGFDPDEAPENLMQKILKLMDGYGQAAIEEMMLVPMGKHPAEFEQFLKESRSRAINMQIPEIDKIQRELESVRENQAFYGAAKSQKPWDQGYWMAAIVRDAWELPSGPLHSDVLLDRIGLSSGAKKAFWQTRKNADASTGFRKEPGSGKMSACIYRSYKTGKRFALARLIGDYLGQLGKDEQLLPVTETHTSRQKSQRAFAQELICPYASLQEHFESEQDINADHVEKAARHYEVSPFLVLHALENHSNFNSTIIEQTRLQLAA